VFRFCDEITVKSSPIRIFELYKDVSNWRRWDPEVKSSELEGNFEIGAYGRLKPRKGPDAEIKIVALEENRSFTVQSSLPLCVLTFEHELRPSGELTRVIHRVHFDGPLSFLFYKLLGRQFRKGIPAALRGLKRMAETQSRESAAA
jgi:hypothetical protein